MPGVQDELMGQMFRMFVSLHSLLGQVMITMMSNDEGVKDVGC